MSVEWDLETNCLYFERLTFQILISVRNSIIVLLDFPLHYSPPWSQQKLSLFVPYDQPEPIGSSKPITWSILYIKQLLKDVNI